MFRRRICTEPGSEQIGSVLVLGAEVVQVGTIQMFGAKQNYSSKHLDGTSTGPGSEQLRRLNGLLLRNYHKVPKFLDARNFAVIHLKFKQRG